MPLAAEPQQLPWHSPGAPEGEQCCCDDSIGCPTDVPTGNKIEITRDQALAIKNYGGLLHFSGYGPAGNGCPACPADEKFSVGATFGEPCNFSGSGNTVICGGDFGCLKYVSGSMHVRQTAETSPAGPFFLVVAGSSGYVRKSGAKIAYTGTLFFKLEAYGIDLMLDQPWAVPDGEDGSAIAYLEFVPWAP